ncbi:CotH kinase family protein [Enhygromyxa salina]|uniref:CotH kinase family protein n=1 Tax=Enhygromyxa salina TaxID=215803 RepID=UPI0015E757EC|nr:CotH kinase family protein [Enhygromyxa salina]
MLTSTLTFACGDDPGVADADSSSGTDGTDETDGTDGGAGLCDDDPAELVRPSGWGRESHCKGATPDYDRLFDDTKVQRLDLTIAATDYADMRSDLVEAAASNNWDVDPIYVPADLKYDGKTWWQIGVRYKGNSSLHSAVNQGIDKLSLRFKFDEYEQANPDLLDQRFYGFKKMTFSNGFKDASLIRDKLGGDIFRAAGVPVARSAFVRIYVDVGDGPTYWGLYTMIEDPSNKMLDSQFADAGGNLYKPDGEGARLQSFDEASMIKKSNEELGDYTDVQALISALNAGSGEQWRAELEAVFDVEGFLLLLAANQSIVNWDSYGWMTHNYYLYADPSDGLFKWIPWDLNESLLIQGGGGPGPGGGGPGAGSDSVLLEEISAQWPMIRQLLDDEVYSATYRQNLLDLQTGAFDLETTTALAQRYHDLIAPYVVGADGEQPGYTFLSSDAAFESSISGGNNAIADHIATRHADVSAATN